METTNRNLEEIALRLNKLENQHLENSRRTDKIEQLYIENSRRTDKIEVAIDLWRAQFQALENTLTRVTEKLENVLSRVTPISDISTRLIQNEERLKVLQDDRSENDKSAVQYRTAILGAVVTGLITIIGTAVYIAVRADTHLQTTTTETRK